MISEAEMKGLCQEPAGRRLISFLRKFILWLLVAGGLIFIAGFFVVPSLAEKQLTRLSGGAVYIQSGRFNGLNSIKLKGLVIASDTDALSEAPILQADECQIKFRLLHFFTSQSSIGSVRVRNFLLSADYQQESDAWSFEKLSFQPNDKKSAYSPEIHLQRGALRVRRLLPDDTETLTTVGFDAHLKNQPNEGEYALRFVVDDRFDCVGSQLEGTVNLLADRPETRLKLNGRFNMGDKAILNNCWHLDQIQLDCSLAPQRLEMHQLSFNMADGQYQLNGSIDFQADKNPMDLNLKIIGGRLSDHVEKNTVVYAEPVLSLLPASWSQFLADYNPAGSTDVDLRFQRNPEGARQLNVYGKIDCRDVSILSRLFPYRVEHLHGPLVFEGRHLRLNELKAKHHDVDMQIDAEFEDLGADAKIDFRIQSPNLKLDSDLYDALNESNKKIWFAFSPGGMTAFHFNFMRSKEGQTSSRLELNLKNASATYEYFPYPMENLTGTVIVEPEQVQLNNLVAAFDDGRKITLQGHADDIMSPKPKFEIHVNSQNIPVNDQLINAMPKEQSQFLKQFEIDATADLDVDIASSDDPKRPIDYTAQIKLDSQRLFYDRFPMEMRDVHLDVDVKPDSVLLHQFECMTESGKITMDGTLMPKGEDVERPAACLNLQLKDIDLNESFWQAMGDRADRLFGKLRTSGKMDVSGLLEINATETFCKATNLKINCTDNPILWDGTQCGIASGLLNIKGDTLNFDNFSLNKIQLDAIPKDLLVGKLETLYPTINPEGRMSIRIEEGNILANAGKLRSMDLTGAFDLDGVSCGQDDLIRNITGHVDAHLEADLRKKTWRALAKYDISDFLYRNWTVSNLTGHLAYDPEDQLLESPKFTADFYDGIIDGSFRMNLSDAEDAGYQLDATYRDVDLRTFLMAGHEDQPPKVYKGVAEGSLNINGLLAQMKESAGKLVINARNLELGKQSLLGKVLTAIQFKKPGNFVFTDLEFQAAIEGPDLVCERIRIVGKPLVFYGNGKLNLDQRQIQASLVGMDKIVGDEQSLLNSLARGVGSALWKIEISGSLDDPKIDPVYLSVLKSPLKIFRKKEDAGS